MKKKQRRRLTKPARLWVLTDRPLHINLALFGERLRMVGVFAGRKSARSRSGAYQGRDYLRVRTGFSRAETQSFFHELGEALDYEMPPILEDQLTDRVGALAFGQGEIYFHAAFGRRGADRDLGAVFVTITRTKALRIFKALADPLGWELYEKEV